MESMIRSCSRCGKEFSADAKENICGQCRKPKPKAGELSFREKQVVELVRQAMANKEIAYRLHLAEGTIKEYLNRIFNKTGVSNRTELAVWAMSEYIKQQGEKHNDEPRPQNPGDGPDRV